MGRSRVSLRSPGMTNIFYVVIPETPQALSEISP
mgnify:CR=1 FL=1